MLGQLVLVCCLLVVSLCSMFCSQPLVVHLLVLLGGCVQDNSLRGFPERGASSFPVFCVEVWVMTSLAGEIAHFILIPKQDTTL